MQQNNNEVTETNPTEGIDTLNSETPSTVEVVTEKIEYTDGYKDVSKFIREKDTDTILFPTGTYDKLTKAIEQISKLSDEAFKATFTKSNEFATRVSVESLDKTPVDNIFIDKINSNNAEMVNTISYGGKELNIRTLPLASNGGTMTGSTAVAMFTSLLGVGEVVQVPLWHSGFWITLRPPKQSSIINLETALAANEITLGRETSTLVYSNYSVIFNRIVVDWVLSHMVNTTLKISQEQDIREFISTQDLYPLILGILTAMHPDGIRVTRGCVNTHVLSEDKTPLCDFIATGTLNTKDLLWEDRKAITKSMLETMSKRTPDSVTINEVIEYKLSVKELNSRVIKVTSGNGSVSELTLEIPSLLNYISNGEAWVQNIITKCNELFSKTDSAELKNDKVNDMLLTIIIGIYNVFVTKITNKDVVIEDANTINEILEVMSNDNMVYKTFINELKNYITDSAIAIVATQNYTCPKCKKDQTSEATGDAYKEFIPLNILETFFDLSALRLAKIKNRTIR